MSTESKRNQYRHDKTGTVATVCHMASGFKVVVYEDGSWSTFGADDFSGEFTRVEPEPKKPARKPKPKARVIHVGDADYPVIPMERWRCDATGKVCVVLGIGQNGWRKVVYPDGSPVLVSLKYLREQYTPEYEPEPKLEPRPFPAGTDFRKIEVDSHGTVLAPVIDGEKITDWVVVGRCVKSRCGSEEPSPPPEPKLDPPKRNQYRHCTGTTVTAIPLHNRWCVVEPDGEGYVVPDTTFREEFDKVGGNEE